MTHFNQKKFPTATSIPLHSTHMHKSHSLTNKNAGCLWNNVIFQPPVFYSLWRAEEAWCVLVQYAVNIHTQNNSHSPPIPKGISKY